MYMLKHSIARILRAHASLAGAGCGALALLAGAPALAQDEQLVIDEVTVTARQIQENLQDVPVAVTAMTEEQITAVFGNDLRDLGKYAPNVQIGVVPGFNAAAIAIRGVSTGDIPSTFDPAVTISVDGFYLGHYQASLLDIFEIEQVEILRGPQGTLFGKNTIGGVVNVTTKRPSGELGFDSKVRVGNEGRLDVMAAADFPIVDEKLSGRIAVQSFNFDGYYTNTINGDDAGGQDLLAGRAKLLFTPNENFDALLSIEWSEDESDTPMVLNTSTALDPNGFYGSDGFYNGFGLGLPSYPGRGTGGPANVPLGDPFETGLVPIDQHTPGLAARKDTRGHWEDILGVYLNMDIDFGGGTLTSITGFRSVDSDYYNDYVGEDVPIYSTIRSVYRDTFSQELRYAQSASERFNYVAGVYYQDNSLDYENNTGLGAGHPFSGVLWPATGLLQDGDGGQDTKAYAVFAEGNLNITDATRITLGARWSDEEKDFNLRPIGATDRVNESNSWSDVTYRAGLDHKFGDNVMGYVTYSTGFKSGGFNEQATSLATAALSFDEEQADSIEVGLKSDLADGRLRLNLAAFYVKYEDLQLDSVIPVPGSTIGQESVITNAGESTSQGLEAELLWLVSEAFTLQGTLGYLDAEYDEFNCDLDRDPSNGNEDCSVLEVKRTPELTGSAGATYTFGLGSWGSASANLNATHTDEFFNDIFNSEGSKHESVTLLNASLSLYNESDSLRVSLYGRNLTDEEYQTSGLGVANLWTFSTYGNPMSYGLEVELRF